MKKILVLLLSLALTSTAFADPVTSQYMPNRVFTSNTPGFATPDLRAFTNVAASSTDAVVITAVAGKVIRVISASATTGSVATDITFNSKGAGAGTAISPLIANGANGGRVLEFNPQGWFETISGQGLTVTTGVGSTTGVLVTYIAY